MPSLAVFNPVGGEGYSYKPAEYPSWLGEHLAKFPNCVGNFVDRHVGQTGKFLFDAVVHTVSLALISLESGRIFPACFLSDHSKGTAVNLHPFRCIRCSR